MRSLSLSQVWFVPAKNRQFKYLEETIHIGETDFAQPLALCVQGRQQIGGSVRPIIELVPNLLAGEGAVLGSVILYE